MALVPCFKSGYDVIDATASLGREEFMAVRIYSMQFSGLPISRPMCLLGFNVLTTQGCLVLLVTRQNH